MNLALLWRSVAGDSLGEFRLASDFAFNLTHRLVEFSSRFILAHQNPVVHGSNYEELVVLYQVTQ
jgi:hypothetical protein